MVQPSEVGTAAWPAASIGATITIAVATNAATHRSLI
jgi:hypothetical protein